MAQMTKFQRRLWTAGKVLISAILIIVVILRVGGNQLLALWQDLSAGAVISGLLLLALSIPTIAGLRLKLVLKGLDLNIPFSYAVRVAICGSFFEQVALGFVAGDAVRIWQLGRTGISISKCLGAIAIDRVLGFVGLLLLCLIGAGRFLTQMWGIVNDHVMFALGGAFAVGVSIVAIVLVAGRQRQRMLFGMFVDAFRVTTHTRAATGLFVLVLALSMLTQILNVAFFALVGGDLGLSIGFTEWFSVVPVVLLVSTLPVSLGGWGMREAAMILALHGFGVAAAQAVVPSLLFGFGVIIVTLPGGLIWLIGSGRPEADAHQPASQSLIPNSGAAVKDDHKK